MSSAVRPMTMEINQILWLKWSNLEWCIENVHFHKFYHLWLWSCDSAVYSSGLWLRCVLHEVMWCFISVLKVTISSSINRCFYLFGGGLSYAWITYTACVMILVVSLLYSRFINRPVDQRWADNIRHNKSQFFVFPNFKCFHKFFVREKENICIKTGEWKFS